MIVSSQWITPLIIRAGRAFTAAKGKDPAIEGAELAEWLRSGAEIGPAEREMLAELVTGEWRNRKGRPDRKGPGHPVAKEIVDYYRRYREEYGPNVEEAAAQATAEKFSISISTVRSYDKERRERDAAIENAKARLPK